MVLTQSEFDEILSNKTKKITENITWAGDKRNSETVKFRVPVVSDQEYPIFVDGSYNRYLERLSYKIIHKEIGRRIDLLHESMRAVNIRGQPTDYALKNYWLRSKSEVRSQESETDVYNRKNIFMQEV